MVAESPIVFSNLPGNFARTCGLSKDRSNNFEVWKRWAKQFSESNYLNPCWWVFPWVEWGQWFPCERFWSLPGCSSCLDALKPDQTIDWKPCTTRHHVDSVKLSLLMPIHVWIRFRVRGMPPRLNPKRIYPLVTYIFFNCLVINCCHAHRCDCSLISSGNQSDFIRIQDIVIHR